MPKRNDIHKVLLIGSGPIQIGQAAELISLALRPANRYERRVSRSS